MDSRAKWPKRSPAWRAVCPAVFLLINTGPTLAQTASVRGQVADARTEVPLAGADVQAEGSPLRAVTDRNGRYLLIRVPPGPVRLLVRAIGYKPVTQLFTALEGRAYGADFALEPSAMSLEAMVVTTTGDEQRRQIGNSVATVSARKVVVEARVNSVSDLLTGRSASVRVMPSQWLGGRARIQIRGVGSMSLSGEPIVILDGMRIFADGLNEIDPNTIESIEVLKGPSATTLYGGDAAGGVIVITTKRSRN